MRITKENAKTKDLLLTDEETITFLCLKQLKVTQENVYIPDLVFLHGLAWFVLEVHMHTFPYTFNANVFCFSSCSLFSVQS